MADGGADPEARPGLDEVSDDDVLHPCPGGNPFQIDRVTVSGVEQVEIPEDEEDPVLRENRQVPGLREIADQEIRQGVSPEIEVLFSRVVREREDRQRGVGGR